MKLAKLPPLPQPALTAWTVDVRETWTAHADKVAALGRSAGAGRNFAALVDEARRLLDAAQWSEIEPRLSDRRFARAVLTVWAEDESARRTMTVENVARFTAHSRLSRLATIQAATLYAQEFDGLDLRQPGLFAAVRDLVWAGVRAQPVRDRTDVVETLRRNAPYFAEPSGPFSLARDVVASHRDLDEWFAQQHIGWWLDSRLGRVARDAFYLAQIDAADAEQSHHGFLDVVTREVIARQKTEETDQHGLYFGHYVLAALTSKSTRRPSEQWLTAMQSFAGDPRMRATSAWETWWARIPQENLDRAVRWLRGVDLRAFLTGVERFAYDTGNEDMQRMLERRAQLLLGLYEQDRVDDVRLILGDNVRRYVERSTRLPVSDVARLSDSARRDTAIIYVDCGDFSLIEGSHSFSLHVLIGEGGVGHIADRRVRSYTTAELREDIPARHMRTHGEDSYDAFRHMGFKWVVDALDFLQTHGVRVDERTLLTGPDFAELSRRRARWY